MSHEQKVAIVLRPAQLI